MRRSDSRAASGLSYRLALACSREPTSASIPIWRSTFTAVRLVAAPHAGTADRLVREELRVEQAIGRQRDADAAARERVELLERGAQVSHVQRARRDHHVRDADTGGAPVVVPAGLDRLHVAQAIRGGAPPEHVQHARGEVQRDDVVAGARQRQRERA